jgi:hypothetical protein
MSIRELHVRRLPADLFCPDGYLSVLRNAMSCEYAFVTYGEMAQCAGVPGRRCLLRHDVDVSLVFALEMARLEASSGVRSTYFFMLRSPAYNLMTRHAHRVLAEIVSLGHEVGIHFDAEHPSVDRNNLAACVYQEVDVLSKLAGATIHAVSFHQPSPYILQGTVYIDGLINTYNAVQMQGWYYLSDSNRQWKTADNAQTIFERTDLTRIQLLIHPMWWMCDEPDVGAVWDSAMVSNFEVMQRQFLETERAYGGRRSMFLRMSERCPEE